MFFSKALPFPAGTTTPKVFISPRIWFESSVATLTSRDQRPGRHAFEPLHADLTEEACLRQVREPVGIVGIGLVRGHVERCLGVARVDADRRQPLLRQGMMKPDRQRPRLEHHPPGRRCTLADEIGYDLGIRGALPAPDPLASAADRYRRLFHRHVETNILVHGCSPSDAWAPASRREPARSSTGEQPPQAMARQAAQRAITPCNKRAE